MIPVNLTDEEAATRFRAILQSKGARERDVLDMLARFEASISRVEKLEDAVRHLNHNLDKAHNKIQEIRDAS